MRAVIKFLILNGKTVHDIFAQLTDTYGSKCPSYSTVFRWSREFRRGRESILDDARSGRPKTSTSAAYVDAVRTLVEEDRRINIDRIVDSVGISRGSVSEILNKILGFHKVSARWVPRMLSDSHKLERVQICGDLLELFNSDPDDFRARYVTMDETWIHYYEPESKMRSKQWRHTDSPPPCKFRTMPSVGKIMASVFWDAKGILLIDYLDRGKTITALHYIEQLTQLRKAIVEKRRGKLRRGILLHHDNASSHTARATTAAVQRLQFDICPHPPYSPDLAPCDFYLFSKLKDAIRGKHYESSDELKQAVKAWFEAKEENFFLAGINSLPKRWTKCVDIRGDYVEK